MNWHAMSDGKKILFLIGGMIGAFILFVTVIAVIASVGTGSTQTAGETRESNKLIEDRTVEKQVIEKLKAQAKKNWPNDYTTQEFWIREQIDAYRHMETIPEGPVKTQAQSNWPLDFTTQRFWYDEQMAAKARLEAN